MGNTNGEKVWAGEYAASSTPSRAATSTKKIRRSRHLLIIRPTRIGRIATVPWTRRRLYSGPGKPARSPARTGELLRATGPRCRRTRLRRTTGDYRTRGCPTRTQAGDHSGGGLPRPVWRSARCPGQCSAGRSTQRRRRPARRVATSTGHLCRRSAARGAPGQRADRPDTGRDPRQRRQYAPE
jgi:hypothetical protein